MNKYIADCQEIMAILGTQYRRVPSPGNSVPSVLDKITATIDNGDLAERGIAFREFAEHDKHAQGLLEALGKDLCNDKQCKDCPIAKYCNTRIQELIDSVDPSDPTMIDLFCGAGGLSLGFTHEGFSVSLANDIEPCCIDTYSHNHPETPRKHIVLGDINNVIANINTLLRFKNVDVIVGGPPCQGFSMANRQRLIDDPRNVLYKSYVEVVSIVQPKFFIMENVKGMLSVADQVVEDFERIGYNVDYHIFNAKDYGVPQHRERLVYIGNRMGYDSKAILKQIVDSAPQYDSYVLADALYGLRPLEAKRKMNSTDLDSIESGSTIEANVMHASSKYISLINNGKPCNFTFNHKARYNNDRDIEIFRRLNQGDNSNDPKIADIMPYARRNGIFKDKYFKLEEGKVSKTITAHMKFDCNMYIHPTQARGLTPREAARIQSYPDDYFFRGAYTKTYMQIGNSVPPLLGRAIAKIIKQYVKGE